MRHTLIETAASRRLSEGFQDKASLVYKYVSSPEFKHKVSELLQTYKEMEQGLRDEQRVMKAQWAKREKQLQRMSNATVAMWGDLQGIAGKEMPELEDAEFASLEAGD